MYELIHENSQVRCHLFIFDDAPMAKILETARADTVYKTVQYSTATTLRLLVQPG